MLQHKTRTPWKTTLKTVSFAALPLLLAGCSGGGNNHHSSAGTRTAYSFTAQFSDEANVNLPTNVRITQGLGSIYTQDGYNAFGVQFINSTLPRSLVVQIGKAGTIQSGDSFPLVSSGTTLADSNLNYNDGTETYIAQSGTVQITNIIPHPANGTPVATATIKFTVSNAILRGFSNPDAGFTVNGTGEVTIPADAA